MKDKWKLRTTVNCTLNWFHYHEFYIKMKKIKLIIFKIIIHKHGTLKQIIRIHFYNYFHRFKFFFISVNNKNKKKISRCS